jgi:hypothetical protein
VTVTAQDLLRGSDNANHLRAGDAVEDLTPVSLVIWVWAVLCVAWGSPSTNPQSFRQARCPDTFAWLMPTAWTRSATRLSAWASSSMIASRVGSLNPLKNRRQQLGFTSQGHVGILSSVLTDVIGGGRSTKPIHPSCSGGQP